MPTTKPATEKTSLRRQLSWPVIVVMLLGGHATLIITAVTMAVGGTGRGVVPDYYQKAIDYDQHKADLATSARLGWQLTLTPGSLVDADGQRIVSATLIDAQGHAVEQAEVHLRFVRLVDGQTVDTVLSAHAKRLGVYEAVVHLPEAGWYQADLLAELETNRFVERQEIKITGGTATAGEEGV
ncbi:MAG: FixH family protein [Planctomycetota bacterium]